MKKKILILSNVDSGLYNFRRELLEAFVANGHKVYCSLPFGDRVDDIKALGCECINTKVSRRGTNPLQDISLMLFYLRLIGKIKPDIVLTYTIKPNIYGGMACILKRVPYLTNVTGLGTAVQNGGLMQRFTLLLYKIGLLKSKTVFFQNIENQRFFIGKRIVSGENVLLPGSGVNLERHPFEDYPKSEENIVLLTIGRIMKDKGTNEILEAAKVIKAEHPNVIFRFIGGHDGNCREALEKAVSEGIVEYVGRQKDVHSFIKESHGTLHASYHEGMSNVLLETAACGRPIISTDVPGCRETYEDGVTGIAFKPRDVEDLIRAVNEFLSLSYQQKMDMGKAGREKIEREFSRTIIVDKYMKIIEEL